MNDAGVAQPIGGARGLLKTLPAADRLLYARREVLHAQACTTDADVGERGDVLTRQRARIDLDRDLGRGRHVKLRVQRVP